MACSVLLKEAVMTACELAHVVGFIDMTAVHCQAYCVQAELLRS